MLQKKLFTLILITTLLVTLSLTCFTAQASRTFGDWTVGDYGVCTEENGVITLAGDENVPGPYLFREVNPEVDFEISLELKAETLGEVSRDPMGAGEGFNFGFCVTPSVPQPGFYFEMRARAGGQFLLVWRDHLCDLNGWGCNWEPFVYNGLGYNNGYDYWHSNTAEKLENSVVKPDVWYTLKLKVQKEPFVVTGEVYNEQGVLLGSYRLDSINNMSFDDIHYFEITSSQGGTFYVRNITGVPFVSLSSSILTLTANSLSNQVGSIVNIQGKLASETGAGIANEPIVLSYTFIGADSWYPLGSAITEQDGSYSFQWLNTASGTITLSAQWSGNNQYKPANTTVTLNFAPLVNQNMFFLESNSTVTAFAFNSSSYELNFDVSGESGTTGYVKLTIDKTLLPQAQNLKIQLDGKQQNYSLSETADSWILNFNYHHSTHHVNIVLPKTAVAENPVSTLTQNEWIIAVAIASLLILLSGLLLFALKKR
jgi:hypothetical protein